MPTPDSQDLIVTLSGSRSPDEVARDLAREGFQVGQTLHAIGVITGSAPPHAMASLRSVSGVADVSEDHPVDIGPPRAPVS